MKRSTVIIAIAVAAILIAIYSSAFVVRETEQVAIVQFGKVVRIVDSPGIEFKIPVIQQARSFEKRWLEWDGDANQITTLDKRYIYIDVFARWRISDLNQFIETLRNESSAQSRLDDIINNATRNAIAGHNLIEIIRSTNRQFEITDEEHMLTGVLTEDEPEAPASSEPGASSATNPEQPEADAPAGDAGVEETGDGSDVEEQAAVAEITADDAPKPPLRIPRLVTPDVQRNDATRRNLYAITVGREKLTRLILKKAEPKAAELGIDLKDIQIKRVNYIESVQAKVFDRMISERQRVAEAFRSQGRGRAAEILGQMEKELRKIRSEAYEISQKIVGRADGEAATIYAEAYQRDPEFYQFIKTMESYRETIDESSWLLLSTKADYAKRFKTMSGD
jgi:modulator of FtsH protease HflC